MVADNAETLFRRALDRVRHGQWSDAYADMKQAADSGLVPAIKELGVFLLHGIGADPNPRHAVALFQQAENEPEAQCELARCLYFGHGCRQDRISSLEWLKKSAVNRHAEALRWLAMLVHDGTLTVPGWDEQEKNVLAVALMQWARAVGDGFARHLDRAGVLPADSVPADPAKAVETWLTELVWETPPQQPVCEKEILHSAPCITVFSQAMSRWQCEYVCFRGAPHLRPSMVLDPRTGRRMLDPVRNSCSAVFDWHMEDLVVHGIMRQACALAGIDVARSEPLHLLRYGIGQEYKPHYDFVGGLENTGQFSDKQRTDTLCLYLNDVPAGGETSFPRLGISVPARVGQVVHFQNVDAAGQPYIDSLHSGQPVRAGEKWLATLWIRKDDTNRGIEYEPD